MAIPYPSNPAVGDTFTYGGVLYTWTGVAWISIFTRTPGTVGSVAVVAPITNSGTPTAPVVGIDQSALLIGQSQVTNLVSDLAGKASTTHASTHGSGGSDPITIAQSQVTNLTTDLSGKANLAGGNAFTGVQTMTGLSAGATTLKIVPAASPSVDILQVRNSADNANLFSVGSGGAITTASALTVNGLASFNNNISAFGTSTFWANQQLSVAVRNGVNAVTDLVQYSVNAGTVNGGVTTRGLIYAGSTGFENNLTYNLSATNPFLTSSTAIFTVSTVQTYNPFTVGQKIIISGASQSQYNGSWITTAVGGSSGAWTVTVVAPGTTTPFTNSGALTATGTIAVEPAGFFKQPHPGANGLVIKGAGVSGTATDVFRYVDSAGATKLNISAAGDIVAPAISAIWSITSSAQDRNVIPLRARFSVTNGQANLQTWETSTTVQAGVNPVGQFFTGTTVPARGSRTIAIPTHTPTGTTDITLTLSAAHNIQVGQTVEVAGVTPSGYNGVWRAQNGTTGSTLVLNIGSNPGAITVAGVAYISPQVSITPNTLASSGLVIKGVASQAANLFEAQSSTGSLLARLEPSGNFIIAGIGVTSGDHRVGTSTYFSAALNVLARATTEIGVVVRGQASQTANLQEWQNSAASVVARVEPTGKIVGGQNITALGSIHSFNLITSGTSEAQLDSATLSVGTRAAGNIGAIIRGATSQTADLQQWQNSAGTVLSEISASGSFYVNSNNNTIGIEFLGTAGTQFITANGNDMLLRPRFDVLFAPADSSGRLRPSNDNTSDLGTSGQRWKTLFASGATLNSLTLTGTTSPITLNGSVGTSGQVLTSAGTGATPTWSTVLSANNPLLTSISTVGGGGNEGGQINFARVTDGAAYWFIDSFGSTASPNLRFVENATVRFEFVSGGALSVNGQTGTTGQVLTSQGSGSSPTWTTVSGGGSFTGGTLTSNLTLAAGTTSLSPLTFQSGTNLTTVTAGANEYDGTVFYKTSNTNPGRALATQNYYYVASTDWNPDFSTSSSAKSLLGAATRGITVAAGTTYEFELYTTIQHDFITTAGVSASVDIFNTTVTGSPVVSDVMFVDFSSNTTGFTTSATMSSVRSTTAVTVSAAISSGSRYTIVKAKGIIRITGTGTTKIYPGIQTTSASGDNGWTIGTGTTFKMTPIGNGTVTTVGTWA